MDAKPTIDIGRAGSGEPLPPQCVTIDFTPQSHDTDETTAKCNEFWELLKNQPELEGIMVTSERSPYVNEGECVPVHKNKKIKVSKKVSGKNTLPALKGVSQSQHKDAASYRLG